MNMDREIRFGVIQWFNKEKGFGVISCANDGKEYFMHKSNVDDSLLSFEVDFPVVFRGGIHRNKPAAFEVGTVNKDNLKIIFSLINEDLTVNIKKTLFLKREGKNYTSKENSKVNYTRLVLESCFKTNGFNENVNICCDFLIHLENESSDIQKKYIRIIRDISGKNKTNLENYLKDIKTTDVIYEQLKKGHYSKLLLLLWKYEFIFKRNDSNHTLPNKKFGVKRKNDSINNYLPFDTLTLIKYHHLLNQKDIASLSHYEIDDSIIVELFKAMFGSKVLLLEDIDEIFNYMSVFPSLSKALFSQIIDQFSNQLIFEAWKNKKYAINLEQKIIKEISNHHYLSKNDIIQESVLIKFSHEIDYSTLERIKNHYENSDDIIREVLKSVFKEPNILSIQDAYRSIKLLEESPERGVVIEAYVNRYFEKSLTFLIDNTLTEFIKECLGYISNKEEEFENIHYLIIEALGKPDCKVPILNKIDLLSFLGDEILAEYFVLSVNKISDDEKLQINSILDDANYSTMVLRDWKFQTSSLTVALINSLNEDLLVSTSVFIARLKECVPNYDYNEILAIYEKTNLSFLEPILISKLSFKNQYELESFLDSMDGNYSLVIERFHSEFLELNISEFALVIKTFLNFDVKDFDNLIQSRIYNASNEELETITKVPDDFKHFNQDSVEEALLKLINKRGQDLPLLDIMEYSGSLKVIEKLLELVNTETDGKVLLRIFNEKSQFKHLDSSSIAPVLKALSSHYFMKVMHFAYTNYVVLVNDILDAVSINKNNINEILTYIDAVEDNKKNLNETSEFKIVKNFISDPVNKDYTDSLNHLFRKSNYSYQLSILKYLTYRYYKKSITKELLFEILNRIDVVQLSSILFRAFITEETGSRELLMDKMNFLLKEHFNKLSQYNLTSDLYNHIFSLSGLIKMCNGRKKYGGVVLWNNGNRSRYYTEGNHSISTGASENLYCDGRFWKTQGFFDSESNQPTGETCNMYWCRNDFCVGINDEVDLSLNFQFWTLNELNELFKLDLDRLVFTHLGGWLNRMGSIIERLKCHSCKEILRPKNYVPRQLGFYAVPLFNCINDKCDKVGEVIRFTHCRGCNKILDSRECETCSTCNWLICDNSNCGQCGCGANYQSITPEYN